MTAMDAKTIVVTGSTRGIGLGLAAEFLRRGHRVMISGRTPASVDAAVRGLGAADGAERVRGHACDVSSYDQLHALWAAAATSFGRVDIWINNAGISLPRKPLWEQSPVQLREIVDTNMLGVIYGSQVALKGMLAQGGGAIYNMEGFGSNNMTSPGMAVYGSTKAALTYFTKALIKDLGEKPVLVGYISPGMVVTDLLIGDYAGDPEAWRRFKRTANILADRVEDVVPFIVDGVLGNQKQGARIAWLTTRKAGVRFATSRFTKRDVFGDKAPPGVDM